MPERPTRREVRQHMAFLAGEGLEPSTRAKPQQHERAEQRAFAKWANLQPALRGRWFHVPNERASRVEALGLASQGVVRGIPDNWLILPVGGRPGAVSELKRQGATRSSVSAEQRRWLLMLRDLGWAVGVHRGWLEASEFCRGYLAGAWAPEPGGEWWE